MADVSITASAVQATDSTIWEEGTLGEAGVAGETVYLDSATGKYMLADSSSAAKAAARGMLMNGGANGQPCRVAKGGRLTVDGFSALVFYYISENSGKLCPYADLGSGEFVSQFCAAISATEIEINPISLGADVP